MATKKIAELKVMAAKAKLLAKDPGKDPGKN